MVVILTQRSKCANSFLLSRLQAEKCLAKGGKNMSAVMSHLSSVYNTVSVANHLVICLGVSAADFLIEGKSSE